jgi:hypothetical protein
MDDLGVPHDYGNFNLSSFRSTYQNGGVYQKIWMKSEGNDKGENCRIKLVIISPILLDYLIYSNFRYNKQVKTPLMRDTPPNT